MEKFKHYRVFKCTTGQIKEERVDKEMKIGRKEEGGDGRVDERGGRRRILNENCSLGGNGVKLGDFNTFSNILTLF